MKISVNMLRKIIKEEANRVLKEGAAPSVEEVIAKFNSPEGKMAWRHARHEFEAMAEGENMDGIRDEFYSGWADEDFQTVLDSVG